MEKAKAKQVTNGGATSQAPKDAIRNQEWIDIWKCLSAIPNSRLSKDTGTTQVPKITERYFTPEQIVRCVRIKRAIKDHYEELYDLEAAKNTNTAELARKLTGLHTKEQKTQKDEIDMLKLGREISEIESAYLENLNKREQALPDISELRFPLSSLEGYTLINNEKADLFWNFLVDIEK